MSAEGIPVSKQVLGKLGPYDSFIQVQRQSYFSVQLSLTTGSLGTFRLYGRCHPNAGWLPIFEIDDDYTNPGNCSLLRFYWSSHDGAPRLVPVAGSFAIGFDCNYFHDVRIETGEVSAVYDLFLYGY